MKTTVESRLLPVSPGELLYEEFLVPLGITKYRLAKDIGVSTQCICDIVLGKRAISTETDLRLCKYFGLSAGYWLRAQIKYDTEIVSRKIKKQLDTIVLNSQIALAMKKLTA
jgi:addiction module HigA family antidote